MAETTIEHLPSAGPFLSEPHLVVQDRLVSGESFELYANEGQNLLKTEPVPSNLGAYYQSNAYYSHHDEARGLMARLYRWARTWNIRWKLRLMNRWAGERGTLLEVGSGSGSFLHAAAKDGWTVTGVEPDAGARLAAGPKGLSLYASLQDAPREPVDAIVLWHVLEHIPDFEGTLREIYNRLKPEGCLIVALPNFKSRDARHYRSDWAGYDVPRHVWHFSRQGISRVMQTFGFREQQQRAMLLDAFYVSWLSEKYRKNPIGPISAFAVGLWSNLSAAFTGEYSSVAYVYKKAGTKP